MCVCVSACKWQIKLIIIRYGCTSLLVFLSAQNKHAKKKNRNKDKKIYDKLYECIILTFRSYVCIISCYYVYIYIYACVYVCIYMG